MGGVPYGRPMAMTADDRDGLALDSLTFTAGPFLCGFPNGLQATVTLQGGVVQDLSLDVLDLGTGASLDDLDATAVDGGRRRLRWLSEALRLGGLDALAVRAACAARDGIDPSTFAAVVRRSGLAAMWSGIGVIDGVDARARLLSVLEPDSNPTAGRVHDVSLQRLASVAVGSDWPDAIVAICSVGLDIDAVHTGMARR